MRRPSWGSGRHAVTWPVLVLALSLPGGLAACTGGDEPREAVRSPRPTSTAAGHDLSRRPAPYRLRLRTVAGHIPKGKRGPYLRAVGAPVRSWVDQAFVRGPWPRERFAAAYVPFGRNVTRQARRNSDLLTLREYGPSLAHVVPERRWIAVSTTALRGRLVGATARVNLRFLGMRQDRRRVRVHVRGDVFLTRTRSHGWKIFGYDLDRWEERGAMTAGGSGGGGTTGGDA